MVTVLVRSAHQKLGRCSVPSQLNKEKFTNLFIFLQIDIQYGKMQPYITEKCRILCYTYKQHSLDTHIFCFPSSFFHLVDLVFALLDNMVGFVIATLGFVDIVMVTSVAPWFLSWLPSWLWLCPWLL